MTKRLFDILFSLLGLIVSVPLFLIIGVLIKMEDKGPIFYRGTKIGRLGVPFKMFKFRTMIVDADKLGVSSTPSDDPRITKVGKFIRKYKLDEIPQFINVFKGEMSFVGPRPQVLWAVRLFSDEEKTILLGIRPGITDLASIKFHNEGEILKGSTDPDKDYMQKIHPEKMRLSMEYAQNISLLTDLRILFRTFLSITKGGFKYEE